MSYCKWNGDLAFCGMPIYSVFYDWFIGDTFIADNLNILKTY